MKPSAKAKPAGLFAGQKDLEKFVKEGLITRGSDPTLVPSFVSTGIPALDLLMQGGIPQGRFMEIFAVWSAGKTLLSQFIAASFQAQGLTVALIDAEQGYDPRWWGTTGVNTEELLISQPGGGEACVDVTCALIGHVDLIIVDSIAGLIPLATQEKDAGESVMGRKAQLVNRLFEKGLPAMRAARIANRPTAVLLINQTRKAFGPGNYDTLPGGVAQQYYSSIMMQLHRGPYIEVAGVKVGYNLIVKVVKHKLGKSLGETTLPISFEGSFDAISLLMSDALDRRVIIQAGPWYRFPARYLEGDLPEGVKEATDGNLQVMGRAALADVFQNEQARLALEADTYAPKASVGFAADEEVDNDGGA